MKFSAFCLIYLCDLPMKEIKKKCSNFHVLIKVCRKTFTFKLLYFYVPQTAHRSIGICWIEYPSRIVVKSLLWYELNHFVLFSIGVWKLSFGKTSLVSWYVTFSMSRKATQSWISLEPTWWSTWNCQRCLKSL